MSAAQNLFRLLGEAGLKPSWQVMTDGAVAPAVRVADPLAVSRALLTAYLSSFSEAASFSCVLDGCGALFYWPALAPDLSFCPGARVTIDELFRFTVWLNADIIGTGETLEEAVEDARREVATWRHS